MPRTDNYPDDMRQYINNPVSPEADEEIEHDDDDYDDKYEKAFFLEYGEPWD
jgi:hypothetical protein